MKRMTFFVFLVMAGGAAQADSSPGSVPDFSVEGSCAMFAGHPRPLVQCQESEVYFRNEVVSLWTRTPAPGQEQCAKLAAQSERGKYEVLARCLRTAISEAAWKDSVGTIKQ
ncbi:MAG TPA: hypothetical protein VME69_00880 [Methylocella sp.]|nr:hypothetical protein [Methylocella sp.]